MNHTYVCLRQCSLFSFRNRLMCDGKSHQTFCALGGRAGAGNRKQRGWGELSNESAEGGFCHLLPSELQQAVGPWKKAAEQSQDVMAKGSTIYINLQVMALNSCKYGIIMRYLQLLIGFICASYFVDPIPLSIWHLTSYINLGCRML
jgi:hypothetical protein